MAKRKKKEPRKGSITATVISILSRDKVPGDMSIVSEVKKRHKGTKFSKAHLAWYKSKYRVGGLTGMVGKRHVIEQKQAPKKNPVRTGGRKSVASRLKPKKKA